MQKLKKTGKNEKAVSTVISVLLMVAIAVLAAFIAFAWMMGYLNFSTTQTGRAIQIQSVGLVGDKLIIYVQNVGQGTVNFDPDQTVYIEGILESATIDFTTLAEGETATINVMGQGSLAGQTVTIKVVTLEGTEALITTTLPGILVTTIQGSTVTTTIMGPTTITSTSTLTGPTTMTSSSTISGSTTFTTESTISGTTTMTTESTISGPTTIITTSTSTVSGTTTLTTSSVTTTSGSTTTTGVTTGTTTTGTTTGGTTTGGTTTGGTTTGGTTTTGTTTTSSVTTTTSTSTSYTQTYSSLIANFDNPNDWDDGFDYWGNPPWRKATDQYHSGSASVTCDWQDDGYFSSDPIDTSQANEIHISFWYMVRNTDSQNDLRLYYSGSSDASPSSLTNWKQVPAPNSAIGRPASDMTWYYISFTISRNADASAFSSTFRFRFNSVLNYRSGGIVEQVWVDDINISLVS